MGEGIASSAAVGYPRAQRARAGKHLLGWSRRVGGRAEDGARNAGVRARREHENVVEGQEEKQASEGDDQGLGETVHEHAHRPWAVRPVRAVKAELVPWKRRPW
jgi:hypothetical protein